MCTVTLYLPNNKDFVLTSNRDEAPDRVTKVPQMYEEDGVQLLYPKDAVAGGTWIGVSDQNTLICLLNGGFKIHRRETPYRLSRGVIVKNTLKASNPVNYLSNLDLTKVEPFTLICLHWRTNLQRIEFVWDGQALHKKELSSEPHIWSSSTLYDEAMQGERVLWFEKFIQEQSLSAKALYNFHTKANRNKPDYDVIMKRSTVSTCSVTQVCKNDEQLTMLYADLVNKTRDQKVFETIGV